MTNDTVERVARAISARLDITPYDRLPWSDRSAYLDTAKDAIAALAEPSEAMIEAGLAMYHLSPIDWTRDDVRAIYTAMIAAR